MVDPRKTSRDVFWENRNGSEYQCPGCGRPREAVDAIEVHHRDRNKRNPDPDNTMGLCSDCHQGGEHGNRRGLSPKLKAPIPFDTDPPTPEIDSPDT